MFGRRLRRRPNIKPTLGQRTNAVVASFDHYIICIASTDVLYIKYISKRDTLSKW